MAEQSNKLQSPSLSKPISTAYARQLAKNYKEQKLKSGDTQAVWYPRDVFEKLLEDNSITGIRLYFGSYGTQNEYNPELPNNRSIPFGKTTIILVPTSTTVIPNGNVDASRNFSSDGEIMYEDILHNPLETPKYPDIIKVYSERNDGQHSPPPPVEGDSNPNNLLYGV